jgi:hypothetical protein
VSTRKGLAIAAALIGLAFGCATQTSITQVWSAPLPANAPPMRRVLVMAVRMNDADRHAMEDAFVAALGSHGVEGLPSYRLLPHQLPPKPEAQALVREASADGILTASFKGVLEELTYVPGYRGDFWGGYYGWSYPVHYTEMNSLVNVETTLWDSRQGDTVTWAALTSTKNPSTGKDFATSVTRKVIPALADARLIPR